MNETAQQQIHSIQIQNRRLDFRYVIEVANRQVAVEYWAYDSAGEPANKTPIRFWIKRDDRQWQPGTYLNEHFIAETDIISEAIKDIIIQRDSFFSKEEQNQGWQSFSLESSHGRFCFSEQVNGYLVVYKQKIGFLENGDELLPDEEFMIIKIGEEWFTCKPLAENSREIFSKPHTDEIKHYILGTHNND